MAAAHPLEVLSAFISRRRGTFNEAEVFHAVRDSGFVFRSFEFARVDGAVLATDGAAPASGNYTERFWDLNELVRMTRGSVEHRARKLVLFDVKSSTSERAENQIYITTIWQQEQTGFYLATCPADPSFVEVFPNRFAKHHSTALDGRKVAVNESRKAMVPPSAYGFLSPCNSSYRMPLSLLPQAIENIRRCAQGHGDYINPWTGAQFTGWKPHAVCDNESLAPTEDSQHYTSFKGLLELWRGFRVARSRDNLDIELELVNLQPQLADFKLLLPELHNLTHRRQVFVQYKIDGLYRSPANTLTKVAIARNHRKGRINYYFTEFERFDYFLYQFDYVDQQKTPSTKFFFLPERVIPDEFYETFSKEADFSRVEFRPYWVVMDTRGEWVHKVVDIIKATPEPRKSDARPHRSTELLEQPEIPSRLPLSDLHHTETFHRRFFYTIMSRCAAHQSGLIIVLSRTHPLGDFAYCRYAWTAQQQQDFFQYHKVPCTISHLPSTTPVIPLLLYTRKREATTRGPSLTATEFMRLNTCPQVRLLIFDVFGLDGSSIYGPLLVVPSDDIRPTTAQVNLFQSNSNKSKDEEFEGRVPLLAELLCTGLNPTDYIMSAAGPLLFDSHVDPWEDVWKLLESTSCLESFNFPRDSTIQRYPASYQLNLQEVHQILIDQHALHERDVFTEAHGNESDDENQ